jgi:hypothetical protein
MEYSISLRLDLSKIQNHIELEKIIYEIGNNCYATNIYSDFELNGINNYIKNNYKIIIIELDNEYYLINLMKLLRDFNKINKINIEYIYVNNEIIYGDKKFISNIENINNKKDLLKKIKINSEKEEYKSIYNLIF